MTSDAVLEFLDLMESSSIEVCLDGGWGIDALVGEQTREHDDLDIILRDGDLLRFVTVTRAAGYTRQPGGSETTFVLTTRAGHKVDVHAIPFDHRGYGIFVFPDGRRWPFPPAAFLGRGRIRGKGVVCLSPDAQVQCHAQGYIPDQADLQDMPAMEWCFVAEVPERRTRALKTRLVGCT